MDQRKEFFDARQMALAPNFSFLKQIAHQVQTNKSWESFFFSFCSGSLQPIDENLKVMLFIRQLPSLQPKLGCH